MYVGKTSASHFASLKWSDWSASPYFWFCFPASSFKYFRRLGLMCLSFCILKSSNNLKIDSIESFIPQWREFPFFWKGILNNLLDSLCAEHSMSFRNITHKVTCGKIMLCSYLEPFPWASLPQIPFLYCFSLPCLHKSVLLLYILTYRHCFVLL